MDHALSFAVVKLTGGSSYRGFELPRFDCIYRVMNALGKFGEHSRS